MSYYKLYHNVFEDHPPEERRELFNKLYDKYEVELVGVFQNRDNPMEYYMLTCYRDEEHYKDFVEKVKQIPEYVEMTQRISEVRISNEVINLKKV